MVNLIGDLFLNWRSPAMGKATSESGIVEQRTLMRKFASLTTGSIVCGILIILKTSCVSFTTIEIQNIAFKRWQASGRKALGWEDRRHVYHLCMQKIEFYLALSHAVSQQAFAK